MSPIVKLDQPPKYWDRLFAPSGCLAMITTVDAQGRVNAATFGTCVRVNHEPVYIAFTTNLAGPVAMGHTTANVLANGEFVVNLPAFDLAILEKVRVVGLPFADGVDELQKAGLTAIPSTRLRPPRILECPRHFECEVEWTKEWSGGRVMVVGKVVAASVDADKVDPDGYVIWDRVRPVQYCGAPYGGTFVPAYPPTGIDIPYEGPEVEQFLRSERAMFKGDLT
jgi:flavin reductase (DIM6/NTAB) family NADH-FMN oxidoreductase RutF